MVHRKAQRKYLYVQTDYGRHLCLFELDEDGGFVVTAPGLSGVITWGKTLAHAKRMVKEAIELCIECLVEETFSYRSKKQARKKEVIGV